MKRFLLAVALFTFVCLGCVTKEVKPDSAPEDVEPSIAEDAGVVEDAAIEDISG